jgi:NAD dependent epimerase/dehydratase family enzyme
MEEANCSCEKFTRLEGASVQAYARAFLDEFTDSDAAGRKLLRCRACGRLWERRAPEIKSAGTRPSLVRLDDEAGEGWR